MMADIPPASGACGADDGACADSPEGLLLRNDAGVDATMRVRWTGLTAVEGGALPEV